MLEEILRAGRESTALLETLRALPLEKLQEETMQPLLQRAIERKLSLSPCGEENIKNLIIRSIKQTELSRQGLPPEQLHRQIEKYDCHQTSLVAKKKVLLFFFIEEKLGVHLEDGQVVEIETVPQLTRAVVECLRERGGGRGA